MHRIIKRLRLVFYRVQVGALRTMGFPLYEPMHVYGGRAYLYPTGECLRIIAGGSGEDDDSADKTGDTEDSDATPDKPDDADKDKEKAKGKKKTTKKTTKKPAKGGKEDDDSADKTGDTEDSEDEEMSKRQARRLRAEQKKRREENTALKKEIEDLKNTFKKAAGVEDDDKEPDEAVKAKLDEKDARIRKMEIKDLVRDACTERNADFALTYGYLLGNDKLDNLDPSDDDAEDDVDALVKKALKRHDNLRSGPAPTRGGNDLKGARRTKDDRPKSRREALERHYGT